MPGSTAETVAMVLGEEGGMGEHLRALGLSSQEYEALQVLVSAGQLSADQLARGTHVSTEIAGALLGRLSERGLAVRRPDDPEVFGASRPSVALGAVLADRVAQLRLAEATISALDAEYALREHSTSAGEVLDVVLGSAAINERLQQIQLGARTEVLSLVKAPVAVVGSADNAAEDVALSRGVSYRVVLERDMLEAEPRLFDEIRVVKARGTQVRVAGTVPLKLFIVDRETALVPLSGGGADVQGALLIYRSGLLDALVSLFEFVWRDGFALEEADNRGAVVGVTGVADSARGTQGLGGRAGQPAVFHPPAGVTDPSWVESAVSGLQVPDDFDLQVLDLLMSGLTDHAVAGALQVSVRTVQRRVRSMMTMVRVDTRLQLGRAALQHGWIRPS